jgi:alanyl-tRNA synthetase
LNEKLPYWTDPHTTSFKVFIKEVKKLKNQYQVHLRENVIRPAGGGQAGDKGVLTVGTLQVSIHDTVIDSGKVILLTDCSIPEEREGQLDIDIEWRTSMMKNHTSEHIFVSTLKEKYPELKIGDLWIDGEHVNIELLNVNVSSEDLIVAERDVQRIINLDIPVQSQIVGVDKIDPSIRAREGLTVKHEKLRIVKVGDLDSSACSGIHVENTGQIGFFKVVDVKYTNGSTRIRFVTGSRAISLTKELYNTVLQRKHTYPFEMEQIGAVLDRAKTAIEDRFQMIEKISQLITTSGFVDKIGDVVFRHEYLPGFESINLKNLANQFSTSDTSVLLLFAPGRKSQIIFRSFHTPNDANYYISSAVEKQGGKGGGSSDNFTGGFTNVENPEELYEILVSSVREALTQ